MNHILELLIYRWRLVGCLDEDYVVILKYTILFILFILLFSLKIFNICDIGDRWYVKCSLVEAYHLLD